MSLGTWRPSTGFLLLMTAGVLWGTTGPAATGLFERTDLSPVATAWLRFVVATPFVVLVGWRSLGPRLFRMPARGYLTTAALGLLMFASQIFFLSGFREIGVTATTLITLCGIPVLVAAFSSLVLGERQGRATWLALALAIGGTALLVLGKPEGGAADGSLELGTVFAVLSAVSAAGFTLVGRSLGRTSESTSVLVVAFISGIMVFSPVTTTVGFTLDIPLSGWLLLAYLSVVTQGVAVLCFQRGLETETATTASVVTLVEPLVAAVLAWIFFDERLSAVSWGGAGLLIGALLLLTITTTRAGKAEAGAVGAAG